MTVQFSELLMNDYVGRLGIRRNHVQIAIENSHQKKAVVPGRGLVINFYSRRLNDGPKSPVILAQTANSGEGERVDAAFQLYEDFCPGLFEMTPTQMLFQVMEVFGLEIQIGNQVRKIILDERIRLSHTSTALVTVLNAGDHDFTQSAYVMVDEENGQKVANCALAYALDTTRYGAYLASR